MLPRVDIVLSSGEIRALTPYSTIVDVPVNNIESEVSSICKQLTRSIELGDANIYILGGKDIDIEGIHNLVWLSDDTEVGDRTSLRNFQEKCENVYSVRQILIIAKPEYLITANLWEFFFEIVGLHKDNVNVLNVYKKELIETKLSSSHGFM